MSERLSPGNGNFTNDHDLDPAQVVHAYYELGAELRSKEIPEEIFDEWESTLEKGRLTPEQQVTQAWIYLEHGFSISQQGANMDPAEQERLDSYMEKACERFNDLTDKPSVKREVRAYAEFIAGRIPALHAMVSNDIDSFREALVPTYECQLKMARELLQRYRRFSNITDLPVMNSLATEMLFFSDPTNNLFTFPAPPRAVNPIDSSDDAWSFFVFDVGEHQGIYRGRVAATSPAGFLGIPPEMLQNDGYPSKLGQGLLQAFVDDDDAHTSHSLGKGFPKLVYSNARKGSLHPAHFFIDGVRDDLIHHVNQSMRLKRQEGEQEETPIVEPMLIYLDTPAAKHPSHIPAEALDILISHYEVFYQADELDPARKVILGWMHVEAGLREVIVQDSKSASVYGAFERAEDIFGTAATKFMEFDESPLGYDALLSKSAAQLYRAIAESGQAEDVLEDAKNVYVAELTDLAVEVLQELQNLDDQNDNKATYFQSLLNVISASLAITTGTHGGYLAAISTMRQRGLTESNNQGWHINVWPLTSDGYRLHYYGRLRLGEEKDESSLNHGIVTVPESMANDGSFSTLRHIIDVVDEKETVPPATYERFIAAATRATEIADW